MSKIYASRGAIYVFFTILFLNLTSRSIANGVPLPPPGQPRYLSMSIMNVEREGSYLAVMERAAAAGINAFYLNVNWERIHAKRGDKPNWSQVDKQAELAQRLGCKIMVRVWVARHDDSVEGWWPEEVRPISGDGVRNKLLNGFSFSDEGAVQEATGFVKEVMEHFRPRQQAGQIVLVSVATSNNAEIGYTVDAYNPISGKQEPHLFDYSTPSRNAFRVWLQAKYGSVTGLNKAWSSDYSRFQDIHPPYTRGNAFSGHYGKAGKDWYLFRHHELKKVIDGFVDVTKRVDGSYKYVNDMGSCYDGISDLRATLGFVDLCVKTDGLKINDDHQYPHRFATDLLRSNLPGKIIGHELGNVGQASIGQWRDYINEAFEHGVDWFNFFGFDQDFNFPKGEGLIRETAARWLKTPVPNIQPTQTVAYTLSEAIEQGTGAVQGRWNTEYAKTNRPIRVLLTEDLLTNAPQPNRPPVVNQVIAGQRATVGQSYQYDIPQATFADPDGTIAGIAATGLPPGIALSGWKLSGRPVTAGQYTVSVLATDNEGGKVSTQFGFTVTDLVSSANQPPVVSKVIPAQSATLNADYRLDLPRSTFTDPDGTITNLNITGLPPGLSQAGESISGKPTTAGTFTATVTATDNKGATVATQFTITVTAAPAPPTTNNKPPVVSKSIPDQQATVGKAFAFDVPKSTFTDPDGTVAGVVVAGLPDGIAAAGWLLLGTPTKDGNYLVTVTATDNQGAKVETEFVLAVAKEKVETVPLTVAAAIPDQRAQVGELFRYVVPANTFAGPVADIAIAGVPAGVLAVGVKIKGTPTAAGVSVVTVTALDNAGNKVSTQFKITVDKAAEAANQPPVVSRTIAAQTATLDKDFNFTIAKETFTDPDGSIASLSAEGLPAGLSLSGWNLTGKPTAGGAFTVTVTATDDRGASVVTQFTINVAAPPKPVNQPPVVSKSIPDQQATVGKAFAFDVPKSTFTDPDGTVAGVVVAGLPEGIAAAGWLLLGTPTKDGNYLVTVTATDNQGAKVETEFVLAVAKEKVETVPLTVAAAIPDQRAQVGELFRYVVPANTFAGPVADIAITGVPAGVLAVGVKIKGTPTAAGLSVVTVTALDNAGNKVSTQFKITVDKAAPPANKVPVVSKVIPDQRATAGKDFTYEISKETFTDPDGSIASLSAEGSPAGISLADWKLIGKPTQAGEYQVKITALDDAGAGVSTQFKFTVDPPVNQPPVVSKSIPDQQATVGKAFAFDVPKSTFTDPDGTVAGVVVAGLPEGIAAAGWLLLGTPTKDGNYLVTVTATDNQGAKVETEFVLAVAKEKVETVPLTVAAAIPDQRAQVGELFRYVVPANTFAGPVADIAIAGVPAGVLAVGVKIKGTPTAAGLSVVTVTAADSLGNKVSTQFKITVDKAAPPANQPPVVSQALANQRTTVGKEFQFEIPKSTFTDPDGTITGIAVEGLPEGIAAFGWLLTGTTTRNGTFTVTVTASDNQGAKVSAKFELTVDAPAPVNQPPVLSKDIAAQTAYLGKDFEFTIAKETFTDPDGTIVGIAVEGLPAGIVQSDWKLTGKPTATGSYYIIVIATDNSGAKVQTQFKLTVDLSPVDNVISLFQAGNFLTRRFIRYIQDGDTLRGDEVKQTVNIMASPRSGAVGSYSFVLTGPYSISSEDNNAPYGLFGDNGGIALTAGSYTLVVSSYTEAGLKGTRLSNQTVRFVVLDDAQNVNLPPALVKPPVDLFAKVGTAFVHRLPDSTFVDPDGRIAAVVITGLPDGLKGDGTLIAGTPTKAGVYNATATATDNSGATTAANFKITVSADNLPPVARGKIPDQSVEVNTAYRYTIPVNTFSDPDGTIVSIEVLGLPEGIALTGSTLSGAPTKVGEYQLIAVAKDNAGAAAQLPFKLSVLGKNRPPLVAQAIGDKVIPLSFPYRFVIPAGTFVDIDGKVVRLTITGLPAGLKASADTIEGAPTAIGESIVVVTAFDDKDASTQLTFRLTVVANQAPLVAKAISDQTVEQGVAYSFVVPPGTFTDADGHIAFVIISGLPQGLTAKGDTISGTPTETGVFAIKVTAHDDKGESVSLTFKLTVTGNKAPLVARAIGDQATDVGADYRFVVPTGTFIDTDGRIARLEISGLPKGLSAKGDTISGKPTEAGGFVVSINAFDDKGASATLTYKLTVRSVNAPPKVDAVPDLVAIVGQVFRFDVAQYFKVSDGSTPSFTYASALPPGITANGSVLAGNPTAVGEYPMKVVARDDKGVSVTVEFMLRVERPELHVFLHDATAATPKVIREIANADIIPLSTLSASLNIFVESNASISLVMFEMTGPVGQREIDEATPFSLYSGNGGFKPEVGTYKLKVTAYRNNVVIATRSIQFDIIKANNSPVRIGADEEPVSSSGIASWVAYPNPSVDKVRVSIGTQLSLKAVEVSTVEGRNLGVDASRWSVEQSTLTLDLTGTATKPGIYLLRLTDADDKVRVIRIMKSDQR